MKSQLTPRLVDEKEWTWTILGLAILFGAVVRLLPGYLAEFPINDGGMFAVMIRDLKASHLALPAFTNYNYAYIPFAYPPLGLYLGALFELLGISEFQMLLWLPALFTIATVPLYYFLALELLGKRPHAALSTVFFALAPGNYSWNLMGGGLTRALGAVFFILSLYFVHRTFREADWRSAFFATLFCALTVLSHPQAALLTMIGCSVFWLFNGRSRISTVHAFVIAIGTLLVTSLWWALVVSRHGLDIFLLARQSVDLKTSLSTLLGSLLARQTIFPTSTILWLLGLLWAIHKRRLDLLLWGFLPYFIDQRSAPITASFLYPMLAAYGWIDVMPALLLWLRTRKWVFESDESIFNHQTLSLILLGVIFYLFIECFFHAYVIRNVTLPYPSHHMMAWVKENTPSDGRFLILTSREDVMTDPTQEWFPALAERHSVTTLQGLEWTLHGDFVLRWNQLAMLQGCRDTACIDFWVLAMKLDFNYIIVDKSKIPLEMFLPKGYEALFDNGRYVVLQRDMELHLLY